MAIYQHTHHTHHGREIQPMRDELTKLGIVELTTPQEVEQHLNQSQGTSLVVINSVCGCAAAHLRPAVAAVLETEKEKSPKHLFTVFAGQDKEATEKARERFSPYPPSSPSVALLKDGQLVYFMERKLIESRSKDDIATDLRNAFQQYC